ncbi:GNAT family N-acetyltransferase [Shimia sp. R11_0]|uniref:GNAT family N-acetyltransferase n=1 Tax=Shimia sp. R11_0 TaxID=2821096 RepID=UPI001ADCE49C|nr:GNAT family N-acetyltransferase [Shimia sp. R11_0]MBO9476677.1 GNAT family N-acetyltransferase [Shimia sp. R11_0]
MIRTLTAADLSAYRALWMMGVSQEPSAFLLTAEEVVATEEAALLAKLAGGEVIGWFQDEALMGFLAMRRGGVTRLRHMADIGPLYVHPQARRAGAARALMTAAEAEARAAGILQLELCVDAENAPARTLYERLGFVQIGLRPRSVMIDGVPRDDLLMLKQLDTPRNA